MIDFQATHRAIVDYRETVALDMGREDQTTSIFARLCAEVIEGKLISFDERAQDAFSQSFLGWTQARGLLRLAA